MCNPILALALWADDQGHWWTDSNWWLVLVGGITAAFICWQSWETQRSARATRKSVDILADQSAILKASVDAAEKNADAARDSALTARISAEAIQNSERAWILAELSWPDGFVNLSKGVTGSSMLIEADLNLTCKNEGRSPAWIDHVHARIDLLSARSEIVDYKSHECGHFGPMPPIGPDNNHSLVLHLSCDGNRAPGQFISIYVLIEYHDIFELPRETMIGYSIDEKRLTRQMGLPERNKNT